MSFRIVIPARFASVRLPGKALREIAGRPLLAHVHDRARESGADEIVVATDDPRIELAARNFGAAVVMTSAAHASGTDRIAAVVERLGWPDDTLVVNLQGDEPLMPPAVIGQVASVLESATGAALATLCAPLESLAEFLDPNVVKVVTDARGAALYFSRAPLPWPRDRIGSDGWPYSCAHARRHIGVYAYRVASLRRLAALPQCELEQVECLEQLRAIYNGLLIQVAMAGEIPAPGVDTDEDLARVKALLENA
ncbi:MAG: 3-deoxy-manno-octulosonate cytidylyltransferase [Gammaproteobacteria bacterium]|nr:3-deoxy-manno-octulosonate cytidylyltransferase [Gammaproteobacteria bacterium]